VSVWEIGVAGHVTCACRIESWILGFLDTIGPLAPTSLGDNFQLRQELADERAARCAAAEKSDQAGFCCSIAAREQTRRECEPSISQIRSGSSCRARTRCPDHGDREGPRTIPTPASHAVAHCLDSD
jgi:hypothetical protein